MSYIIKLFPNRSWRIVTLIVFISLLNKPSFAQFASLGLPKEVLPFGVGVNTHFVTGGAHDLDMIKAAGFKFIRTDMLWSKVETTTKGVYDWTDFDTLVAQLDQRGLRALLTLNLNNQFYETADEYAQYGTRAGIVNPDNITGFANFAAAAAERYKGHNIVWEIYNEPNQGNTWKPMNGSAYAKLALAACKAIHDVDPEAVIVGPSTAGVSLSFCETVFQAGLLQYYSGVAVHCYRDGPPPRIPETVGADFKNLASLIAKYAPAGKKISIISGEWGYSTASLTTGVSPQTQSDYFARMMLYNLYSGVPLTIWYDWKNDGTDPTQIGQNRGVVTSTLMLKPSYTSVLTLTSQLNGYRIDKMYVTGYGSDDVVLILKDSTGGVKVAAWTQSSTAHNVKILLSALPFPNTVKKVWWVDVNAGTGTVDVDANSFTIKLSGSPRYYSITPPVPLPVEVPSVPVSLSPTSSSAPTLRKAIFKWNSSHSDFGIDYRIQVASDSSANADGSFLAQNIVFDTTLEDTLIQLSKPLDASRTYFWHVSSYNLGGASAYSPANSFKTGTIVSLPSVPAIISPAQLATDVPRKTNFSWSRSDYADKYRIQIATEYHTYASGDSAGRYYSQNVVFDATLADTTIQVSSPLDASSIYFWHVNAINAAGESAYSGSGRFTTGSALDDVEKAKDQPKKFELLQNYPNPFNPSTTIRYSIPGHGLVRLKVFNIIGQEIATLVNSTQDAGYYEVNFNAEGQTSGIYLCRLEFNGSFQTRKIIQMK